MSRIGTRNCIFIAAMLLFSLSLAMVAPPAEAMPPHPDLKAEVRVRAIEIYVRKHPVGLNAPGLLSEPSGIYRALVLLVDFNDNEGQSDRYQYRNLLFSAGTYATGSMRDYYREVSYNRFDITGDVNGTIEDHSISSLTSYPSPMYTSTLFPSTPGTYTPGTYTPDRSTPFKPKAAPPDWFRMPQKYSYYVDGESGFGSYPTNAQKLAEDAVSAADPYVDYRLYDNDGDGEVDSLFILHAGLGAESSKNPADFIWSHRWEMKNPPVLDGMKFKGYSMEPEYTHKPGDSTIGVFCHEYGHELGLPDLYDVGNSGGEGIGCWGLMSAGSWNGKPTGSRPAHLCAWSKIKLGWVTPVPVESNQIGVNIPDVETQAYIFLLWTNGTVGDEYFLVENRQKMRFDDGLPGEGLLIYHVDDRVEWQDDPAHYKVDIEQADGVFDLNNGLNTGDDGDPWPGIFVNRNFDQDSVPDSTDYNGRDTQVAVKNISDSAPVMSADFYVTRLKRRFMKPRR